MQEVFNIREGSVVFQNWEVIRKIGFGASGTVYEIRKSDSFIENTSVVKVFYIPPDYSMEEQLKSEGMSTSQITEYVRDIVDTLIDEVKIMISLKEFPYIVRCEDHELICAEDESQWCILIRMEKLTPLMEHRLAHPMTERDVLKLATDMAKTLQLFERNGGIIHRDIKPQNLFVSPYGDYKLGDFGIARICSAAASAMSRKGTEEYMAPEVYWNELYDSTVDIYSLGLVLYQLLNKNRLPFFPLVGSYNRSDSMPHGHMYLTAIIDWHSRLIVGWNLSDTLDTFYVIEAVKEAIKKHGTPGTINSDQGSQFTSTEYKAFLRSQGIIQSMDGKSRCADNIMIERWFRSLKVEEIYPNEYATPKDLRQAIAAYIRQYNNERPHEALGYCKPIEVYNSCFEAVSNRFTQLMLAG